MIEILGLLWFWLTTMWSSIFGTAFSFFILFTILSVIVFAMTMVGARTTKSYFARILLVLGFSIFIPGLFFSLSDMLGRPKPISMYAFAEKDIEVNVITALLKENEAIYLYIVAPGAQEPTSLVLPWDTNTAKRYRDAKRQSEASGGRRIMMRLSTKDLDALKDKPLFYLDPQPELPPKHIDNSSNQGFEMPSTGHGTGAGHGGPPRPAGNNPSNPNITPDSTSTSPNGPIVRPPPPRGPGGH